MSHFVTERVVEIPWEDIIVLLGQENPFMSKFTAQTEAQLSVLGRLNNLAKLYIKLYVYNCVLCESLNIVMFSRSRWLYVLLHSREQVGLVLPFRINCVLY